MKKVILLLVGIALLGIGFIAIARPCVFYCLQEDSHGRCIAWSSC